MMKNTFHMIFLLVTVFCLFIQNISIADESKVRIRIIAKWGGGGPSPVEWDGEVIIRNGKILDVTSYDMESDENGLFNIGPNGFRIQSMTRGAFDDAQITIEGNLDSEILFRFGLWECRFRIRELLGQNRITQPYGKAELSIWRDPVDILSIKPMDDQLVISPGEVRFFSVYANPISGKQMNGPIMVTLAIPGTSFSRTLTAPDRTARPVQWTVTVPAPEVEGVYDLVATARNIDHQNHIHHIQFVVIDPEQVPSRPDSLNLSLVQEINCNQTHPPMQYWEAPDTRTIDLTDGTFRQTSVRGRNSNPKSTRKEHHHMGWFGYQLNIREPGIAHIVDISYPGDRSQTVGVSIIETDEKKKYSLPQLDAGFYSENRVHQKAGQSIYRLIFWPRSSNPILLFTNRLEGKAARIGNIKVYKAEGGLPSAGIPEKMPGKTRLIGIYYEEPNMVANFGGVLRHGKREPDWKAFYSSGRNLVDYLKYVGMNAVLMQSFGYQTSLYPTAHLGHDTYRYDNTMSRSGSADPFKKDILKLYFSLLERDNLFLIPSINFEQTIPELEKLRNSEGNIIADIDMIRNNGRPVSAIHGKGRKGLAPWYDPVHPDVQSVILKVVEEIARRYARYPSFTGLSIQHRGLSFVQYPGLDYGYGDYAIARFENETGINVPIAKADQRRFEKRYQWLMENAKESWVTWRCQKLSELMLRIQAKLRSVRPDLILFVSYMNTLDSISVSDDMVQWHKDQKSLHELFRVKGLDPSLYMQSEGVIVTRPERTAPVSHYIQRNGNDGMLRKEIWESEKIDRLYTDGSKTGIIEFHDYFESSLEDFDTALKLPGKTWLVNTIVPAGREILEPYSRWMANMDPRAIFTGGWMAPMGGEGEFREFAAAFLSLPAISFDQLKNNSKMITVRKAEHRNQLFFYVVNRSDDTVIADLYISGDAEIESLTNQSVEERGNIRIELPPFAMLSYKTRAGETITISDIRQKDRISLPDHAGLSGRNIGVP